MFSWTREDSVRRREGNEAVLYVTSAILEGTSEFGCLKKELVGHCQRMRRNAQNGVKASGLYDFIREIFLVPV